MWGDAMRVLLKLFGILSVLVAGYVALVLHEESETTAIVRLLGPGYLPTTCAARAKPNFE